MLLFVRDVPAAPAGAAERVPLARAFPMLARKPSFWLMAAAASCSSLAGYGLAVWTPSVLERSFGFDLIDRGHFLASIFLIGGTAGVFAGGWLADRLGQADRAWYARLPAIAWLITAPMFALGLLVPDPVARLAAAADPECAQHPVAGAGHDRRPASRPAADAGDRLGQLPADQQSHRPRHRPDADRRAVGPVQGAVRRRSAALRGGQRASAFYLIAALLMFFAVKRLRADWVDD